MGELVIPVLHPERYRILRARTNLDLMRLDEELSEMSVLLHEAGELTVMASDSRDMAKQNVGMVEAQVANQLRGALNGATEKAPSEAKIASMLPDEPSVVEARDLLRRAEFDAALWRNLQDVLRTKSSSIRAAADLIAAGYLTADHITSQRRKEIRAAPQPRG